LLACHVFVAVAQVIELPLINPELFQRVGIKVSPAPLAAHTIHVLTLRFVEHKEVDISKLRC
jgi:energy-converting hydrogenase Eha subunit A